MAACAQAAAGYVEHVEGQFRLPPEQALALAVEDSPVYVAGGAVVLASLFLDKDKLVAAMRGDGALAWSDHHPSMFGGTERFFRPGYRTHLVAGVAARSGGRRAQARSWGHGSGCRMRAWGVDGHHGTGVPGVALFRLRLSCPLHRHGDATR